MVSGAHSQALQFQRKNRNYSDLYRGGGYGDIDPREAEKMFCNADGRNDAAAGARTATTVDARLLTCALAFVSLAVAVSTVSELTASYTQRSCNNFRNYLACAAWCPSVLFYDKRCLLSHIAWCFGYGASSAQRYAILSPTLGYR